MKINGRDRVGLYSDIFVLPRPANQGGDVVFKLVAILDYTEFETLCPLPKPKMKINHKGERVADEKDKGYAAQMEEYASNRFNWLIITTLRDTPGLEWSKVNPSSPGTWKEWTDELKDFGLTPVEINLLTAKVMEVNSLTTDKMLEARERFLALAEMAKNSESST